MDMLKENEISDYALQCAQDISKDKIVLKTDAYNEAKDKPRSGGIAGNIEARAVYLVEPDAGVRETAQKKGFFVADGDIRKLPYKNSTFDAVLDISTIDHIPEEDIHLAIEEYNRVLKDDGEILMFVWTGNAGNVVREKKKYKDQYYFSEGEIVWEISKYFGIIDKEIVFEDGDKKHIKIIAKK